MSVRNWSEDIIIVQLPAEPHTSSELETVIDTCFQRPHCDVILDFSRVDRVTCLTLCQLTRLHKTLMCSGRRLAFCKVAPITRDIFEAIGFDRIFADLGQGTITLEASPESQAAGTINLKDSENNGHIERRSYFRLNVSGLDVKALLWRLSLQHDDKPGPAEQYWQGRLLDISEAGAKIAIDAATKPDLQKDQFTRLVLTETPIDRTVTLDAKIREVLPGTDQKSLCFGLQFIALEANPEGRQALQQLCDSMAQYYQAPKSAQTC